MANRVFLIGNAVREPELASSNSGTSYCKFSIAVSRKFSKDNETDFFNVVTFKGLAENCNKYIKKGMKVAVIGQVQNSTYQDKDGNNRTSTQIVADEVEFLSTKAEMNNQEEKEPVQQKIAERPKAKFTPVLDSDLPF